MRRLIKLIFLVLPQRKKERLLSMLKQEFNQEQQIVCLLFAKGCVYL